jgi:hypothetical protein
MVARGNRVVPRPGEAFARQHKPIPALSPFNHVSLISVLSRPPPPLNLTMQHSDGSNSPSEEKMAYPEYKGHEEQLENVGSLTMMEGDGVLVRPARVFTADEERRLYTKVSRTKHSAFSKDLKLILFVPMFFVARLTSVSSPSSPSCTCFHSWIEETSEMRVSCEPSSSNSSPTSSTRAEADDFPSQWPRERPRNGGWRLQSGSVSVFLHLLLL